MVNTTHEHKWVYLRQEEKNIGYPVTNVSRPTWEIYDVYFCEGCLEYGRVHVRTEEQSLPESYTNSQRLVTWRMP